MGCMSEIGEVARSAEAIVLFEVRAVRTVTLTACPAPKPDPWARYERCGAVAELQGEPIRTLKGVFAATADPIRLPLPNAELNCDDRPEAHAFVSGLKNSRVILFLEKDGGSWWTLEGPDSIYSGTYEAAVRSVLDATSLRLSLALQSPSSPRGTVFGVRYTIKNEGKSRFRGCVGSQHSWRFNARENATVDRAAAGPTPRCDMDLDLGGGAAVEWSGEVFVPADTPPGPAVVQAHIQLLAAHECDAGPCGYAYLDADAGPLQVTTALERAPE